jgi:hypothetical protein
LVIEETPYGGLVAYKAFRGLKTSPQALIDVGSNMFHLLVGEVENGMSCRWRGRRSLPVWDRG